MEANDSSLELLEVSDVVECLEDVILELLFVVLLFIQALSEILNLISQTFLSHSQIIDDKGQVLVDTIEVLQLLSHLVGLLVQLLDLKFSWSNISFELLDFVIEHKLELLQLLSLLLEVNDPPVLVFNRSASLFELTFLAFNLLFQIAGCFGELFKVSRFLLDLSLSGLFIVLLCSVLIIDHGQVAFGLHTGIDMFGQLFLVLIFQDIDRIPGIIFNSFSHFLMVVVHLLHLCLQVVCLLNLPVQVNLLILIQLLDDLLVMQSQFR